MSKFALNTLAFATAVGAMLTATAASAAIRIGRRRDAMKMTTGVKIGVVAVMATAWIVFGHGHALALDPSDVLTASAGQGCTLIPYDSTRLTCIAQNNGLHFAAACGALACQQTAGVVTNTARKAGWQNCVARRTTINGNFSSTVTKLKKFKTGPVYKGWQQKPRAAVRTIITNIELRQPTHSAQLTTAKGQVVNCNRFVD